MSGIGESHDLLSNASATGAYFNIKGGRYVFAVEATFGGGNVKLQFRGPNGTAIDVAGSELTVNGAVAVDVPAGSDLRAAVTTATAVYARLTRVLT